MKNYDEDTDVMNIDSVLIPCDRAYGTITDKFKQVVKDWVDEHINKNMPAGIYTLNPRVYQNDYTNTEILHFKPAALKTAKDLILHFRKIKAYNVIKEILLNITAFSPKVDSKHQEQLLSTNEFLKTITISDSAAFFKSFTKSILVSMMKEFNYVKYSSFAPLLSLLYIYYNLDIADLIIKNFLATYPPRLLLNLKMLIDAGGYDKDLIVKNVLMREITNRYTHALNKISEKEKIKVCYDIINQLEKGNELLI